MKRVDMDSIRDARNNLRLVKKYNKRLENDANFNAALEALEAVLDRNFKNVVGLDIINAECYRRAAAGK